MDEFEIIRRFFTRPSADDSVALGVGDDGAILVPEAGRQLVWVLDTIVDGVHYPDGLSGEDVGFRAVAVNLSDLAAMAARPRWMTLALTLPRSDAAWLEAFAGGLGAAASAWQVPLVGGDTTRGAQAVVSVAMLGDVARDRFLTRAGARPGDELWVTGTPGDAAGGLASLAGDAAGDDDTGGDRRYLERRFLRPEPRVAFGLAVAGLASAAIDVSDGLLADAGKLLAASAAGGSIDLESLPLSGELRRVFGAERAERLALAGGDDYELCFTAAADRAPALRRAAERLDLRVTRIGRVVAGTALQLRREGEPLAFPDDGYRHF